MSHAVVAETVDSYRRLGFYQLLDPDGPQWRGRHAYVTILEAFLVAVLCVAAFGTLGFLPAAGSVDDYSGTAFEIAVILFNCTMSAWKMYALARNADAVWELLMSAVRADFPRCAGRDGPAAADLARRRTRAATITDWIARSFLAGLALWAAGPFAVAAAAAKDEDVAAAAAVAATTEIRRPNVVNLRFPVSAAFYDRFYYAFYAMELAVGFCIVYGSVLVDAYLMSFCWIVAAQYQAVAAAYAAFGHDYEQTSSQRTDKEKTEIYNDFKSIVIDHQNVYLKMKSFYAVVRPITLIHVFAYSCSLIVYAYVVVTMFHSQEPLIFAELMKIITTVSNIMLEVFIYCYLFELVDDKKEAVNFGLYSCNWTGMDIKFKKLLLMAMKMNNANRLKLKATANITIDRPFFANVVHTCFKIVSVLTQTQSNG